MQISNNGFSGVVSSKDAHSLKEVLTLDLNTTLPANENGSEEPFLNQNIKRLCYRLLPINPAVRN
jgi:hypothetical protein